MIQPVIRALVALVLAVLLPLGLAAPASAGREVMGVHRAGTLYLRATCDAGNAHLKWSDVVFGGKDTITRTEVARRLGPIRKASGKYSRALFRVAHRLTYSPASWPVNVERPIYRYVKILVQLTDLRYNQSNALNAAQWMRLGVKANRAGTKLGPLSTQIRLGLDLPPRGEGC